ncbi:unnamed protein product [Ectocarpus sp. 12 AP-2014]
MCRRRVVFVGINCSRRIFPSFLPSVVSCGQREDLHLKGHAVGDFAPLPLRPAAPHVVCADSCGDYVHCVLTEGDAAVEITSKPRVGNYSERSRSGKRFLQVA